MPMLLATSVSQEHSKCWNVSIGGYVWVSAPNGGYDAASSARHGNPPAKPFYGLPSPPPCQTALEHLSALTILGPCRPRPEEILTSSSSQIASAGARMYTLSPPRSSQQKVLPTSWLTALSPSGDAHQLFYPTAAFNSARNSQQPSTNSLVCTNSRQAPTTLVVTGVSNA